VTTVVLDELCTVRSSVVDPTSSENRDLLHVAPNSIERDTGRLLTIRTAAEDGITSGKYRFESGDILYSKIRPYLNKVARVDFGGLCSADMYAIKVNECKILPDFLVSLLRSSSFLAYAHSLSSRSSIPKVNRDQFLGFEFELPAIEKQRRIAAILGQADTLRAKRRRTLTHFAMLPQAIYYEMFGDPDLAVSAVRFGDVASLYGGRSLVADDECANSAYRVLKISAVTSGTFEPLESKPLPGDYQPPTGHLVRSGDLLMSRANTAELVGAVAYVYDTPPNLALPDKIWRFTWHSPSSVPIFYYALLQTQAVRRRVSRMASGTGGSMKNVSKAKLENLMLPDVDPGKQRLFAERVAKIPRPEMTQMEELLATLQSRAFRGEL
jgi:type I restriction enzyme S subunit